jgi:hypothetical protein
VANQQKPKRVGRPKLPKGEAKGKIVPIRFTKAEVEQLTKAAKASDKSISEWIRSRSLAALGEAALGQSDNPDLDFHPVKISGEPLSTTILRERR